MNDYSSRGVANTIPLVEGVAYCCNGGTVVSSEIESHLHLRAEGFFRCEDMSLRGIWIVSNGEDEQAPRVLFSR